jgi:hypothetical protein
MGRYREAVEAGEEGLARAAVDVPGVAVHALSWSALAHFRLGEWDKCLADVSRMEELLGERRTSPPYFGSRPFAAAALIHEIRGNATAADTLVSMLINLDNQGGLTTWTPWLGPLFLHRGENERAYEMVSKALTVGRWAGMHAMMYEALCDAMPAAGRWDVIHETAETMRTYAERGGFASLPYAVDRLEGHAALHASDPERAADFFRRSAEGFSSLEAAWEAALSGVLLGETLIGLGRRKDAEGPLRRALETFERLRAPREQAQVRELLA